MSVETTRHFYGFIYCDGCGVSLNQRETHKSKLLVMSYAKKWVVTNDDRWLCPECSRWEKI